MNKILKMGVGYGLLVVGYLAFAKPSVGTVTVSQDGQGRVAVGYALSGEEPGIVTVDFTCGDQPVEAANYRYVWGDVNRVIQPGADKKIWWDARRDWPGHDTSDGSLKAIVKAWATNAPPMYIEINLLAKNSIAYYSCEDAVPFGVTADVYKTDRMLLRRIPAKGVTFRMGSPSTEAGRASEEAAFLATFSSDYYIGVYPVTQRQFYNFHTTIQMNSDIVPATPGDFTVAKGYSDGDFRPVERISFFVLRGEKRYDNTGDYLWPQAGPAVDSSRIIGRFRQLTGLMLDLPTSAQWELACRAGASGALNVDGATLDEIGWFAGNSAVGGVVQTHPVGLKQPNAWGLYDMLGNIMEWCLDCAGTYPTAETIPYVDWGGPNASTSNNYRIRRGGSYDKSASTCRNAALIHDWSVECSDPNLGFRLCCPAGEVTGN